MEKNKIKKGFTLVELIVVIGIIGILAVVAIVAFGGIQASAQRATIQATANQVVSQVNIFNNQATPMLRLVPNPPTPDDAEFGLVWLGSDNEEAAEALSNRGLHMAIVPSAVADFSYAAQLDLIPDGIFPPGVVGYERVASPGPLLVVFGVEPVGNITLARNVLDVLSWDSAVRRWVIDHNVLATMP